jgi:hypothetical protein
MLATPIPLTGLVGLTPRSYWASHFYSVLECLRYHRGLYDWTPAEFKGHVPNHFFDAQFGSMRNWVFQYLLVNLLNLPSTSNITDMLLSELSKTYGEDVPMRFTERRYFLSGRDSGLSVTLYLSFRNIWPGRLGNLFPEKLPIIANSDICLILTDPASKDTVGIFGESEGLHGNKIRRDSFWSHKHRFCVFAFGTVKEKGSGFFIESKVFNGVTKVLVTLQADNFVAKDFLSCLSWMKYLFRDGTAFVIPPDANDEIAYFINLIKMNWHTRVSALMSMITPHIQPYQDLMQTVPNPLILAPHLQAPST